MKLFSQTPTIEPHSARATAVLGAGDRPRAVLVSQARVHPHLNPRSMSRS